MQYLIPNHQDRIYIISMIMGAIVNVCLNAMLIPVVGAIGAAIGTIGAEELYLLFKLLDRGKSFH